MRARRALLAWLAIVAPLWIVLVLCTHWEPISHDGWGHYWWHRTHDVTLGNLFDFARGSYEHNNPRLGQLLTLLLFTPGPWHSLVTPAIELALFYMLAALALGRWPSWRRCDDALLFLTIVAMTVLVSTDIGPLLFYRPYVGNYTFGLAISVGFLIPYRFAVERQPARESLHAVWQLPAMFAFGVATGLCNEHTGPAVAALAVAATIATRPRIWMIAGIVGIIAGGLLLYLAPGQNIRYDGLATQQTLLARVASRSLYDDAVVLLGPYLYALPIVPWLAIAVVARRRSTPSPMSRATRRSILALALGSLVVLITLLASPKQGARLDFAAQAFAVIAAARWTLAQLTQRWSVRAAAGLAAGVLLLAGWRCLHAYSAIGPEFATRLNAFEHAAPGSNIALAPYSFRPPRAGTRGYERDVGTVLRWFVDARWFIGDELLVRRWRLRVERAFDITITLTDPDATVGEVNDD
jgi:hypothetical protein